MGSCRMDADTRASLAVAGGGCVCATGPKGRAREVGGLAPQPARTGADTRSIVDGALLEGEDKSW